MAEEDRKTASGREDAAADGPASPCVRICVMHPQAGLCIGCLRTLEEIAAWGSLAAAERRAILQALPGRAPLLKGARRGGRRGRLKRGA